MLSRLLLTLLLSTIAADEKAATPATDAVSLWTEYKGNELAADKKYQGKYIELRGSIVAVRKNGDKGYYVGLSVIAGQFKQYPPSVLCYLSPAGREDFAKVKPGVIVTVRAKVNGRRDVKRLAGFEEVVWEEFIVELEDTNLVPPKKK